MLNNSSIKKNNKRNPTASSDLRLLGSTWLKRKALKRKGQKTHQVIMTGTGARRSLSPPVLTDEGEDERDGGVSERPPLLCARVHGEGGGL